MVFRNGCDSGLDLPCSVVPKEKSNSEKTMCTLNNTGKVYYDMEGLNILNMLNQKYHGIPVVEIHADPVISPHIFMVNFGCS
jgi:hypothetical protein